MAFLELTEIKAKQVEELETKALNVIKEALDGKRGIEGDVKLAMQTFSAIGKLRQSSSAQEAIRWSIMQNVANNEEQRKWAKENQPEIKKALLPGKKA